MDWNSNNNTILTKELIEKLFFELNELLEQNYKSLSITVYGGSALALYEIRNSTEDLDISVEDGYISQDIQKIINIIGKRYNLNDNWLNESVMSVLNEKILNTQNKIYKQYSNLVIFIPSMKQLLAMKIMSGRAKDIIDIDNLIMKLNLTSKEEILKIVKTYYGNEFDLLNREYNNKYYNVINSAMRRLKNE